MSESENEYTGSSSWGTVFSYCSKLEHDKPGIFKLLGEIIGNNATDVVAMSLSELKETYEYMRGEPFPIEGDALFTRRCMLTVAGVVATSDGLNYYSYVRYSDEE